VVRFQIILDPAEADLLSFWAKEELRDPRDQIRFILRNELERRGFLQNETVQSTTKEKNDVE
jgi:hypothetical protein